MMRYYCFICLFTFLSVLLLWSRRKAPSHRLAILLPYTTTANASASTTNIPPYFEVFCVGAANTKDSVDFFIIHTGLDDAFSTYECPPNVKLHFHLHSIATKRTCLCYPKVRVYPRDSSFSICPSWQELFNGAGRRFTPFYGEWQAVIGQKPVSGE